MPLPIKGIQKMSLIDYPGKLSAVLFIGGCNLRCPFCHNRDLVLNPDSLPTMPEEDALKFLESRKQWIDGVCITGGEPCMHRELPYFIEKVKKLGLAVKLDTNGTNSTMLRQLIKSGMLDYIAMDIKAPLDKYREAAGTSGGTLDVRESVREVMGSGLPHEFRTTVLPRLHTEADILAIGEWLKGADLYVLQQFRPMTTLDPAYLDEKPFTQEKLESIAEKLEPLFKRVGVR